MLAALALSASQGCAMSNGPKVHFASATEAQLKASASGPVWYEFREGDEVPLALLYKGVIEAGTPVRAKAKKKFWLIVQPNAPAQSPATQLVKIQVPLRHSLYTNFRDYERQIPLGNEIS